MSSDNTKTNIEISKYIISSQTPLLEAMRIIDETQKGIVFVVDDVDSLVGTLTDGDVRRWILQNGNLEVSVDKVMHLEPKYLHEGESDNARVYMKGHRVSSIPIVDDRKCIVDICFDVNVIKTNSIGYHSSSLDKTDVIIMAGGKGTRLYPYTKILPKPLIPIGDIPVIERIINRFYDEGANRFYIIVNYKKEMIKSYFAEVAYPYEINFINEDEPLGTAGGIRLINREFVGSVIVTNCDILVDADYENLMDYHEKSGNDMTIVSSLKKTVIPYGVLHSRENGIITSMEEKPCVSHFINTGMYVVKADYLKWIPKNESYHMTDLADNMIENGKQVGMYPISENSFLDMGQFEELQRMEERLSI